MKVLKKTLRIALVGLAIALGLIACSSEAAKDHAGQGVVVNLDASERKITLDHGDIPGFMRAMTMTFELAPEVSVEDVEAGDEVDFRVMEEGGVYRVTEIRASGS